MKKRKRVSKCKNKKRGVLPALLLLCVALTACAGKDGGDSGNGSVAGGDGSSAADAGSGGEAEDAGKSEPSGPVEAGDDYRDFTAVLTDGSSFTLSDYEGTVIFLNFWATWCGPCVREMPAFPMLVEKYGDDLTLLAVNAGESEKSVRSFLEKNGYEFPVALDLEGEIGNLYPSDGIPYTVLIGRDGKIASVHLGADTAEVMYEFYCEEIDRLLGEE